MKPEPPPRWRHIERLLDLLAREGMTIGVMERVRLEHVLGRAGVPTGDVELVTFVDADPEPLQQLLRVTLAKSPAERELVAGVEARWRSELPRAMRARAPGSVAGGAASMKVSAPMAASAPRARSSAGMIGMLVLLAAGLTALLVWLSSGGEVDRGNEVVSSAATEGVETERTTLDGTESPATTKGEDPAAGDGEPDETGGQGADTEEHAPDADTTNFNKSAAKPAMVEVLVPTLTPVEDSPGTTARWPWSPLMIGVVSLAVFLMLWLRTRRRPLLPGPSTRAPRAGTGRVQPELDRGPLPAFVERSEQDTLVWGIGREVSDTLSERLDAVRTIEATIAQGGLPQLWFEPHMEHRGVWLWRDRRMKTGQADAKRLEQEIVRTLDVAGLPVHVATFTGVPDRLDSTTGPSFAPHDLDDQRRHARVVVLTDGHGLLRGLRTARMRDEMVSLLRRLQGWHALAFVVFGDHRAELEQRLAQYGIDCIAPPDAVAHLAGALREGVDVERERELLRWEVVCALAPRRIREADALALRAALGLQIEGFAIEALRREHGRGQTLLWDSAQRAEVLARYDRAYGYTAMGPEAAVERTLLGRALEFWRDYYAQALEHEELDVDTAIYLEIEALVLGLWSRPVEVVRGTEGEQGLYGLFQHEALAPVVRELLEQYTDVDGDDSRVRMPWRFEAMPTDVQLMLATMGFGGRTVKPAVQRAGRWGLGLGMALGVGLAALSVAGAKAMKLRDERTQPPTWRGSSPNEPHHWRGCTPTQRTGTWRCWTTWRHGHVSATAQSNSVLHVAWTPGSLACEETLGLPDQKFQRLRCTSSGQQVVAPPDRALYSVGIVQAEANDRDAMRMAQALLDSGSVDHVWVGPLPEDPQQLDTFVRRQLGPLPEPSTTDPLSFVSSRLRATIGRWLERARSSGDSPQLACHRYPIAEFAEATSPPADQVDRYVQQHGPQLRDLYERERGRYTGLPPQSMVWVIEIEQAKDARARLDLVRTELSKNVRSFSDVARETSVHVTGPAGGKYGWVDTDPGANTGLPAEVHAAIEGRPLDRVSPIIETEGSLWLLQVTGHRQGDLSREDAMYDLAQEQVSQEQGKQAATRAAMEQLRTGGSDPARRTACPDGPDAPGLVETNDAVIVRGLDEGAASPSELPWVRHQGQRLWLVHDESTAQAVLAADPGATAVVHEGSELPLSIQTMAPGLRPIDEVWPTSSVMGADFYLAGPAVQGVRTR